jgi:hypothetical protein
MVANQVSPVRHGLGRWIFCVQEGHPAMVNSTGITEQSRRSLRSACCLVISRGHRHRHHQRAAKSDAPPPRGTPLVVPAPRLISGTSKLRRPTDRPKSNTTGTNIVTPPGSPAPN